MKKKIRFISIGSLFLICTLLAITSKIFTINKTNALIECPEKELQKISGDIKMTACITDRNGKLWFYSERLANPVRYDTIKINPSHFPNGVILSYMSDTQTPFSIALGEGKEGEIYSNASTTAGRQAIVTAEYTPEQVRNGITISPYPKEGRDVYFYLDTPKKAIQAYTPPIWSGSIGGTYYNLYAISISLLLVFLLSLLFYMKNFSIRWGFLALSCSFFLATLNYERPFRGMAGAIDAADDTYYTAYAISHITEKNMFKCDTNVPFSNKQHVRCYGLPGTPIMLEAGLLLRSIFTSKKFFGEFDYGELNIMRMTSAFYTFMATVMLFLALRILSPNIMNIILAISLIWGTSLAKWGFDRSIFTHSPEMFLLCSICFILALLSKNKIHKIPGSILLSLIWGMIIFVRGEYILAFLLPCFYQKGLSLPHKNRIMQRLPTILYLLIFSVFILLYKEMARRTSAYASGAEGLIFKHFSDLWSMEFHSKLFDNFRVVIESFLQSGGLPFIAAFSFIKMKVNRNLDPFLQWTLYFVLLFFTVTTLFYVPLGSESQHRYYLKLYPFFFIYINSLYGKSTKTLWKSALLILVFTALFIQYRLVENDLSGIVAGERFKNLLTDDQYNFFGNVRNFYGNYTLSYIILCIASIFPIKNLIKIYKS